MFRLLYMRQWPFFVLLVFRQWHVVDSRPGWYRWWGWQQRDVDDTGMMMCWFRTRIVRKVMIQMMITARRWWYKDDKMKLLLIQDHQDCNEGDFDDDGSKDRDVDDTRMIMWSCCWFRTRMVKMMKTARRWKTVWRWQHCREEPPLSDDDNRSVGADVRDRQQNKII